MTDTFVPVVKFHVTGAAIAIPSLAWMPVVSSAVYAVDCVQARGRAAARAVRVAAS